MTGPRPVQGASFPCSGPAQRSAKGAPFDPDVLRLWLFQAHEIMSQHSQVSLGSADGRHSLSAQGNASDHSVSRDVRGESCSVGECSHACEAGGKAPCDGLLDPLPPKSWGLQLHHVTDRRRRRAAMGTNGRLSPSACGGRTAHATASESVGIIGSSRDVVTCASSFNSSCGPSRACMSYLDAVLSAPARAPAAALVARCSAPSSSAVGLCMHAHGSLVHDACSNSWSDTSRVQGPTGTMRVKGGVSGPAEDLRPVSEVEAGVNFRPAGGVRGQVAGSLPGRQPGTGTRQGKGGVVTPSLHPEVPGIQFVSPGRGLDIRQSMGWTKVCGTTRSGIWVLKGNARARMLPENLDHLRVRWISRGTYETAWVTPGHDCLCSYQYGHGAAVRPQTNDAIWHGVIGLWGRVAPLLSPWCARREVPTGVNLNRYSGPSSCIRWHGGDEPLFGPQNAPVSMSLGNSVEFQVRRGQGGVPSSITLDHGDILVMDGLTQSEYVHCTGVGCRVLGLTLLPVGLPNTLRPVHSRGGLCPPFVCARFSRAGSPRGMGLGK